MLNLELSTKQSKKVPTVVQLVGSDRPAHHSQRSQRHNQVVQKQD